MTDKYYPSLSTLISTEALPEQIPPVDKDGKNFQKFRLKVQGLDSNGESSIVSPSTDIFVYTTRGFVFASEDFANAEMSNDPYNRNYEERIGFENREPSSQKRYEDFFIEKDTAMKTLVDNFIAALNNINAGNANAFADIKTLVETAAKNIFDQAVSFVQANNNANPDDRPLYWARNKMLVALKQHPYFFGDFDSFSVVKPNSNLSLLVELFEENSRNYTGVDFFGAPSGAKKILITGFDPFFLMNKKEQWNPSGQAVLSMHGKTLSNGFIQSMIFPVRYIDFDKGFVEKYILPHIQNVHMIITISQGLYRYDVERFASKFRTATTSDNLNVVLPHQFYLPSPNGISQVSKNTIPEFLETTLPINTVIPGSLGNTLAVYNQKYKGTQTSAPYSPPNSGISNIIGPNATEKALEGSGGTYLSNEIFYRVAVLRSHLGLCNTLKSGHLHVPILNVNDLLQAQTDTLNAKAIIENAIQGL